MERKVMVWSDMVDVSIYQKSKTVWIAVGTYMDQRIEGQGRTPTSAVTQFQRTAKYRGG